MSMVSRDVGGMGGLPRVGEDYAASGDAVAVVGVILRQTMRHT
jgi:hypothetical protein